MGLVFPGTDQRKIRQTHSFHGSGDSANIACMSGFNQNNANDISIHSSIVSLTAYA